MNIKQQYFLYGFLFGICFPLVAIILELKINDLKVSVENIALIHKQNMLLFMIDTAPLFLGLFALLGGFSKYRVSQMLRKFIMLSKELSRSNDFIEIHAAAFFKELTRSTQRVEEITTIILKSNASLYSNNENNRKFAEKIYDETSGLLLLANEMAKYNRAFKHLMKNMNVEIERFRRLMENLSDSLKHVGALGKEINIISINSGIEAHKAGDAGKGFNVISHEVKLLSEQIRNTIGNTQAVSTSLLNQVSNIERFVSEQNKNQESIVRHLSGIEEKTIENKHGLNKLYQLLKDTHEIQQEQKHAFAQMLHQIEEVKNKRAQIMGQLKQGLNSNSALIIKLGKV